MVGRPHPVHGPVRDAADGVDETEPLGTRRPDMDVVDSDAGPEVASSESGQALKSPVITGGKAVPLRWAATNSASTVTCSQRTAEPSTADVRCVVKNGTG